MRRHSRVHSQGMLKDEDSDDDAGDPRQPSSGSSGGVADQLNRDSP